MLEYLIGHSMANVWNAPRQDNQSILEPHRLTGISGVMNKYRVQDDELVLPEQKVRFHVYQVGQLKPELINILEFTKGTWGRVDELINSKKVIVEGYTQTGEVIPKYNIWYQFTKTKNLIFAVKETKALKWNMASEPFFVRVYDGAYFHINRQNKENDFITSVGKKITTDAERTAMIAKYTELKTKELTKGALFAYIDGILVHSVSRANLIVGQHVDFLYDTTVYKKISIAISDMDTFDSILDAKRKYLYIHNLFLTDKSVDYFDDVEFYVRGVPANAPATWNAYYYHRNNEDAVRQLTHRDYSIVVGYVEKYVDDHPKQLKNRKIYVDAYVRRSGYDNRVVSFVNPRIHELYKLGFAYRKAAMLGVRSNVAVWRADNLETSAYTELMRQRWVKWDKELAQNAYGYNALSYYGGNTPTLRKDFVWKNDTWKVRIPYALQLHAVVFEYDKDGRLIDWYNSRYACWHTIKNPTCELVEIISGNGREQIEDLFNEENNIPLYMDAYEYRVYRCPEGEETIPSKWEDITGGPLYALNKVSEQTTNLVWLDPTLNDGYTTMIRSDRFMLLYNLDLPLQRGLLDFTISQKALIGDNIGFIKMLVPMGQLDIFLNGYSLIEGVDYIVDFPRVIITNKKYLNKIENTKQKILVRFHGFCDNKLKRDPIDDVGYINNGTLSRNKTFNIRDDKVMRFVVGGGTRHRSVLGFSENNSLVVTSITGPVEGTPYLMRDIIVPKRDMYPTDTYVKREEAMEIDKQISDYIGQYIKDKTYPRNPAINGYYNIYSPIASRCISDILLGGLNFPKMTVHYDDNEFITFIETKYGELFGLDPVMNDEMLDYQYVDVHPHPFMKVVQVNVYEYKFLAKLNRLFLNDKMNLSHFVMIGD